MKSGKGLCRKTSLTAKTGLTSSKGLSRTSGLARSSGLSASVPTQRPSPPPTAERKPPRGSQSPGKATAIPPEARAAVYERDENLCARCGCWAGEGNRSVHHRRPRASGGQDNPHALSNLVTLHGALGTVGCHGEVEMRQPAEYANGYLVRAWENPLEVPVLYRGQWWVLLDDEGGITAVD